MNKDEAKIYHEELLDKLDEIDCTTLEFNHAYFDTNVIELKKIPVTRLINLIQKLGVSVFYYKTEKWDISEKDLYLLESDDFCEIKGISKAIDKAINEIIKENNRTINSYNEEFYTVIAYYFVHMGVVHHIDLLEESIEPPDVEELIEIIKSSHYSEFEQIQIQMEKQNEIKIKELLEQVTNELIADSEFAIRKTKDSRLNYAYRKFSKLFEKYKDLRINRFDINAAIDKAWIALKKN